MNGPTVIGIDSSTQSFKLKIVDPATGEIRYECVVDFDRDLACFGTTKGVLAGDREGEVIVPVAMVLAALEMALGEAASEAPELVASVVAIGFSAQQHMLVWLQATVQQALASLDLASSLPACLGPALARPFSANWQDQSTGAQCLELRAKLGGTTAVANLTGSDTAMRFAAAQIRKLVQPPTAAWARTAHLQLLSSFLPSVVAGRLAGICRSDGLGMNLADVSTGEWSDAACDAVSTELRGKLPELVPPLSVVGRVSPYFVTKFGIPADAIVVAGLGDNPASYLGCGMVEPGATMISLGTSYTLMACVPDCRPSAEGYGHVFGCHLGADARMVLACFSNGSLTLETVRDRLGLASWDEFNAAARSSTARTGFVLPWLIDEITPRGPAGLRPHGLDPSNREDLCRGVVVGQALALRAAAERFNLSPTGITVTGGGSQNELLCQNLANVFGCEVRCSNVRDSAPFGAAVGAAAAYYAQAHSGRIDWPAVAAPFTFVDPSRVFSPEQGSAQWVAPLMRDYVALEAEATG